MNDEQGPMPLHERGARIVVREAKALAVDEAKSYLFWKLFVPVLGLLWTWLTVNPPNNGPQRVAQGTAYVCAAKASLRSIQTTNKSKCAPGFDIVTVRK
jgi:hypothetical protein